MIELYLDAVSERLRVVVAACGGGRVLWWQGVVVAGCCDGSVLLWQRVVMVGREEADGLRDRHQAPLLCQEDGDGDCREGQGDFVV